jgi:IS605 OrfB family transposase
VSKSDHAWRDAVWATHECVNNGAKVFGDWLLTFRGGLDHSLADVASTDLASDEGKKLLASKLKEMAKGKDAEGRSFSEQDAIAAIDRQRTVQIRNRRILLALSWLSVESTPNERDSYKACVVACGTDSPAKRNEKVIGAFQEILTLRGVTGEELKSWMMDCEPSISAAIRDDAVWVNRNAMFDRAQQQVGPTLTREEVWDLLQPFFGSRELYLTPITKAEDFDDAGGEDDKAKDLVQKAGQWLSSRFGTGGGANFLQMSKVYVAMTNWAIKAQPFASGEQALLSLADSLLEFSPKSKDASGILRLIGGPGYKSATRNIIGKWQSQSTAITETDLTRLNESAAGDAKKCDSNTGGKGHRPYSDKILEKVQEACGFTYLQSGGPARHSELAVMLDHAARRVSIGHTWIKRAESERQKFKIDSEKIERVPADIRAWLDNFCADRSRNTGAIEAYRIRRRAVGGWKEVVAKWATAECKTHEDRIAAAREVQADPDIDKFGDIQLFEALAADDAIIVWRVNGETTPQHLLDYAAATDALAKQKRFKVPAYRHPDPLLHPVFCDFGNSRWEIRFAVHDAASKLSDAAATVTRREKELTKAQMGLAKTKTPEQAAIATSKLKDTGNDLAEARKRVVWLSSRHALSMGLWTGGTLDDSIPLRWSCKRLMNDLGLRDRPGTVEVSDVTRADRLGRAAVHVDEKSPVNILGVFKQADWNGRLQAPRAELNAIAKQFKKTNSWNDKAKKMRNRISWLVSFSAKLQQAGPWFEYSARFPEDASAKPFISRKGEYAVKHKDNDKRAGQAKLILSRLPELRVLSVDLGHRFAAGCAVWETLSHDQLLQEIKDHQIIAGGNLESDLFLHTTHVDLKTGKPRTTIYRRIGAVSLPDGKIHPSPWARLDRQFLIKVPGEDRAARAASLEEMEFVSTFAEHLGQAIDKDRDKSRSVNELMSRAIRVATLGLKRHARRAKIAYALNPTTKTIPGIGGSEKEFMQGGEDHIKFLTSALFDWHSLASESRWNDPASRTLWNEHIAQMDESFRLAEPLPSDAEPIEKTRPQRRKEEDALREKLKLIAIQLCHADRSTIHRNWCERWNNDDGHAAVVETTPAETKVVAPAMGWHASLRLVSDWIMGRRFSGIDDRDGWKQNVGGLTLTRIATMKSLYQLHKAFAMRSTPVKPRGAPDLGQTNRGLAQSILEAMEQMREQRVKQIASRIAAGALGLAGHWKRVDTQHKNTDGTPRVKSVWVDEQSPRFKSCHAIVIEDLTNYRPDEIRTRRENMQLMVWSAAKVKKHLSEACQLHGLHLRQVQPGYTSKQDSRTGAPGIRCKDVSAVDFTTKPWWRRQVKLALEKGLKVDDRERYLALMDKKCLAESEPERTAVTTLRIPTEGGEIFVSSDPHSPAAKGLQADLNAAANIGLRALLDPDFTGKWWFIPCESATHKPLDEKTKGSDVISATLPLSVAATKPEAPVTPTVPKKGKLKPGKKQREIINLWRDVAFSPIDANSKWRGTAEYWNYVRSRVISLLGQTIATHANERSIEQVEMPW